MGTLNIKVLRVVGFIIILLFFGYGASMVFNWIHRGPYSLMLLIPKKYKLIRPAFTSEQSDGEVAMYEIYSNKDHILLEIQLTDKSFVHEVAVDSESKETYLSFDSEEISKWNSISSNRP